MHPYINDGTCEVKCLLAILMISGFDNPVAGWAEMYVRGGTFALEFHALICFLLLLLLLLFFHLHFSFLCTPKTEARK